MHVAHLSLGSNLGDRAATLQSCIRNLARLGNVRKVSSFYETEPMEIRHQPWFLNCVVELETNLMARDLLLGVQSIEAELGRHRDIKKGPRTIDVDILLFDSEIIYESDLQIPHRAMHERRFVLAPLTEISPQVMHPALRKTAEQLLRELPCNTGEVRRLATK